MYLLTFQSEDMLKLCLKFSESQSIYMLVSVMLIKKECFWVIYPQHFIGNNENIPFPLLYYILQLCPPR